ncbi:MAG: hypothetical protein QOG52_199 [Frankiaceae bacterium]|nr:hypothetical protein [Frankiaceae bacterium]
MPTVAAGDPRARLYIVDELAPGAAIQRRLEITNASRNDVHVEIFAAAAAIVDGSFVGADGRTANDLSSWTTASPAARDIPANGRAQATVSLAVPEDAPLGEQYAIVWVEVRSAPAGGGVVQVNRVGIRMYVSVGPGGTAGAAHFGVDTLTAQRDASGVPVVTAAVHNTGQRALDVSGTLSLTGGPGGLSTALIPAERIVTLEIGASTTLAVRLDTRIPTGPWNGRFTVRSGLLEQSVSGVITFPAAGMARSVPGALPSAPWRLHPVVIPTIGMLLFAALTTGMIALRVRGRHRLATSAVPRQG